MKKAPQGKPDNFIPSAFSGDGFMGDDLRTPAEIVADDGVELERRGLGPEDLARILEQAYDAARGGANRYYLNGSHLSVEYFESMGRIPCPFGGHGVFEKGEAVVTDPASGERIIITRLGVHLMRHHGFFQGRGSRYRVEPALVARLFGLGTQEP